MQQADGNVTRIERSTTEGALGALEDPRLFIVRPTDKRLARVWDEAGGFEQSDDGPTFIVIGRKTTDDKCKRLAGRFYRRKSWLNASDLIAFRDSPDVEELLSDPAFCSGRLLRRGAAYGQRRCVVYRDASGREQRTPWFADSGRASQALAILKSKGRTAIMYVD